MKFRQFNSSITVAVLTIDQRTMTRQNGSGRLCADPIGPSRPRFRVMCITLTRSGVRLPRLLARMPHRSFLLGRRAC